MFVQVAAKLGFINLHISHDALKYFLETLHGFFAHLHLDLQQGHWKQRVFANLRVLIVHG